MKIATITRPEPENQYPNPTQTRLLLPDFITNLGIYKKSVFPYLPEELIEFIKIISPDPEAWFVGQFTSYLLRPKNNNILGVFICYTLHSAPENLKKSRQKNPREIK